MAKSMVERYEQVLAQDPASTVFVELAKALIEKGDHARAIQICEQGVLHHPDSVVGRVLWGKALIHLGKPAQAMGQFDSAIEIDRENAHAYNLIGEVLLHKGLYRSALPILKKAMALQPNEGRVKQWYEQAQRALTGGPAPVLTEITSVDAAAAGSAAGSGSASGAGPAPSPLSASAGESDEDEGERTQIYNFSAGQLGEDSPATGSHPAQHGAAPTLGEDSPRTQADLPALTAPVDFGAPALGDGPEAATRVAGLPILRDDEEALRTRPDNPVLTDSGVPSIAPVAGPGALAAAGLNADGTPPLGTSRPTPAPEDPFDQLTGRVEVDETVRGLTSTYDALKDSSPDLPDPFAEVGAGSAGPEGDTVRGLTAAFDALSEGAKDALLPQQRPAKEAKKPSRGGLLDDLPFPTEEDAPPEPSPMMQRRPPPPVANQKRGLLDDLPELAAPSHVEVPKVELSAQATKAMAEEYERELRERIKSAPQKKSFFARHGVLSAVSGVVVLALVAFVGNFLYTRAKNQGQDLKDTLASARKLVATDTRASLTEALGALEQAKSMDEDNAEAWALTAYANALLVAEHGVGAERRALAQAAIDRLGDSEAQQGFVLLAQHLLATGKAKEIAQKPLLDAAISQSEVHEAAGRILLARKASGRALERFKQALSSSPTNVRALVALGGYYQEAGDCTQALSVYVTAEAVSPLHPARTVGAAECRLERELELDVALREVAAIAGDAELPPGLMARRELVYGQLLSHAGQHEEALKRLTEGAKISRDRLGDFQHALGQAHGRKGDMDEAQKALEAAFQFAPGSEKVKESLGRVLIARDHPSDVLKRITGSDDERRVALVRGIAAGRLGQWKRARAELTKTQVDGRFPAEAVIQLTLADAAEGHPERAQEVLEKTLAATRKAKSEVRVALGQVYWQRGVLDKARTQFEEALKDDEGYEGGCSLGRLLLTLGFPDLAIEPLTKAVQRNGSHGEAREALGQALVAVGKLPEALAQYEAWQLDNPQAGDAFRGSAFTLFQSGKFKEADAAIARAVKLESSEPRNHRVQALVRFARGDAKNAFSSLERANKLEGEKKDPETFCEIANAFLRVGESDKAQAAFSAALRFDARAPCALVGQYTARLPASDRAMVKALEELAEKTPHAWHRSLAQATLARALLSTGQVKSARAAADEALRLAPHSASSHYASALVALRVKDDELATKSLLQAALLDGAHAMVRLAYADALSRGGRTEEAIDEYETVLRLGAPANDQARVKKILPTLKKRLAQR